MEPVRIIISLLERGLSLSVNANGLLSVKPPHKIRNTDREKIKQHRDTIIAYLADPVAYAIAYRAEHDEPSFPEATPDTVPYVLRESVIVTAEGWPTMALSPEFAAWWEEHNRQAQLRHERKQATPAPEVSANKSKNRNRSKKQGARLIEETHSATEEGM